MSYAHIYGVPWRFFMDHKTPYMCEGNDKKIVVFAFDGRFDELLPTVLGFYGDLQPPEEPIHV
jgi:hypothetical protein